MEEILINVQGTNPLKVLGFTQEAMLKLLDGKLVTIHTLSNGFICLQEQGSIKLQDDPPKHVFVPGAVYLLYLGGNQNV